MADYLCIENTGLVEKESLTLMGVSSKRNDKDKIGYFGSGNKYAIACLLKNKVPFKIFSEDHEYKMETVLKEYRGEQYNQIIIDGKETSLTVEMGPRWELWYAIREIISNALDEKDFKIVYNRRTIAGKKNKTQIYIQRTKEINDIIKNIHQYFIFDREPISTVNTEYKKVSIYDSDGEFIVYRKGIRINRENNIKSLYNYDFDDIDINESRIYEHEYQVYERIAAFFAECKDESIILNYIKNWAEVIEKRARWDYVENKFSEIWHKLLSNQRILPESISKLSLPREDIKTAVCLPDSLCEKLKNNFDDLCIIGDSKMQYIEYPATKEQIKILNEAIEILKNYNVNVEKYITVKFKMADIMGSYDQERNIICISIDYLESVEIVIEILFEEWLHSQGYNHGTREFDEYLIRLILKLLKDHNIKLEV